MILFHCNVYHGIIDSDIKYGIIISGKLTQISLTKTTLRIVFEKKTRESCKEIF